MVEGPRKTKLVFLEAFLLTVLVFGLGLFLGIFLESSYEKRVEQNYLNSEIYLLDALALTELVELQNQTCPSLIEANILFADRIYEEARKLEDLEKAGKLKDNLELIHRRYDLLRTFLWISSMKVKETCGENFSTVIYIYEYKPNDLAKLATQELWERVLGNLKAELGDEIILIPIAGNSDITTLDILLKERGITAEDFPVVIINEEHILKELSSSEQLKALISESF
jgi:hypothetical protein